LSPDIAADAATSQVFYVIRGSGHTRGKGTDIAWTKDDIVALPGGSAYRRQVGSGRGRALSRP
jgi:hypothetical protein